MKSHNKNTKPSSVHFNLRPRTARQHYQPAFKRSHHYNQLHGCTILVEKINQRLNASLNSNKNHMHNKTPVNRRVVAFDIDQTLFLTNEIFSSFSSNKKIKEDDFDKLIIDHLKLNGKNSPYFPDFDSTQQLIVGLQKRGVDVIIATASMGRYANEIQAIFNLPMIRVSSNEKTMNKFIKRHYPNLCQPDGLVSGEVIVDYYNCFFDFSKEYAKNNHYFFIGSKSDAVNKFISWQEKKYGDTPSENRATFIVDDHHKNINGFSNYLIVDPKYGFCPTTYFSQYFRAI